MCYLIKRILVFVQNVFDDIKKKNIFIEIVVS